MTIRVSSRILLRALGAAILFLCVMHVLTQAVAKFKGAEFVQRHHLVHIVREFNLDEENNVGTWYQTSTLLISSGLLAAIASLKRQKHDRFARHWTALAVIFVCLSVDEEASLHETATTPIRALLHTSGFLTDAWVIAGVAAVTGFVLAYLGFLKSLRPAQRAWFMTSGAIFVAGAIGGEMLEAAHVARYGTDTYGYPALVLLEESLEMIGIFLFIRTLLAYIESEIGPFGLAVVSESQAKLDGAAREVPTQPSVASLR